MVRRVAHGSSEWRAQISSIEIDDRAIQISGKSPSGFIAGVADALFKIEAHHEAGTTPGKAVLVARVLVGKPQTGTRDYDRQHARNEPSSRLYRRWPLRLVFILFRPCF